MLPRAKKSFSQNFLTDATVLGKILAAADLSAGDHVLEIGPGTGVLTKALLDAGAHVVAVEADADLVPALRIRLQSGGSVDVIEGDILALRQSDPTLGGRLAEGKYALVANIPYHITSPILEEFLSRAPRPIRLVLMVQEEVADRLVAEPGDMSLLGVMCQLYAHVRKVARVPRGAFRPAPKVDSAVICLDVRGDAGMHTEQVIRLAKAGFSAPRKQLHGNMSAVGYTSAQMKHALEALGLRPDARAEMLSAEQWTQLWAHMNTG